ncbi:YdcF family protein [Paenibacillus crassostreae]|uniref:Multidrug MFS transporter n=1 Tax=Paenibacillus crassostreae TaxID=1763538 RepID=A0A167AQ76_9BACL|nr:YdcF family protein [Paenibacillus crassostreae]AOZ93771.1 multidrug MFS transporter [Paenibacillus crassostreae]OAB71306.1 multidrug MFS transporter [Paenibacillus crassostreae]
MTKKVLGKLALVMIFLILVLISYSAYRIWSFGDKVEFVKSDAAIVLGAAAWDGEPSPVLSERINHAISLYENGYVDTIIFTGGKGDNDQVAESEVARDYAISNQVDAEDILIETQSTITEENLKYAYEIASKHNLKTFTIVSDPLHMKRATLMANNMGMKTYSSPTQSSAYQTLNSKIPFLLREVFLYIGYIGYIVSLPFR